MPHSRNILLVEDEHNVASFVLRGLTEEGYTVSLAPDGNTGLDMAMNNRFGLIILDIMLPGISGIEICRQLRASGNQTPILMLTALGTTENIVAGLDNGADDYLVKPFRIHELMARIRSLLRRTGDDMSAQLLSLGPLQMDTARKSVHRDGRPITLTATEYRLLEYLMKNRSRVVSRMDILEHVWGVDFNMGTNVVDVYVNYLRRKIDKDMDQKLIHTVVGMGYILKEA